MFTVSLYATLFAEVAKSLLISLVVLRAANVCRVTPERCVPQSSPGGEGDRETMVSDVVIYMYVHCGPCFSCDDYFTYTLYMFIALPAPSDLNQPIHV